MKRGFLKKSELGKVTYWKSSRSAGLSRKNTEDYLKGTKRFAFEPSYEGARVACPVKPMIKKWETSDLFKWGLK